MIYYLVFWAFFVCNIFLFICRLYRFRTLKIERVLYIFFSIVLFSMAALRTDCGYDYTSYENIFNNLHDTAVPLTERIFNFVCEPGYNILNIMIPGFRFLLIIVAALSVFSKAVFFYQNSKNKVLCLFMYYCSVYLYYDMGIMRQGIAISIILLSLKYIDQKKFWKFVSGVLLAMLFHVSAIFAVPLYFIKNREYSRKFYYVTILMAILINGFSLAFINLVRILNIDYLTHRLEHYLNNNISNLGGSTIFKRLVILVIFVEVFKNFLPYLQKCFISSPINTVFIYHKNNKTWLYINAYFISVIELILFSFMPIVVSRGCVYLYLLQILVFEQLADKKINRWISLVFLSMVFLLFYNSMNSTLTSQYSNFIPYKLYKF